VSYRRPVLYPKQEQAIFSSDRYGIIEGSTKCGKTVACIAWILEQAMKGKQGQTFWWISPVYPQAKIAFRRLKRGLPDNLFKVNESELTVTLANGATIAFKSAEKPDNLYGEDVYAAVMDEATRIREEAWHAVRSTLTATRGFIRIIGNVKGRRNWAYALARKAEGGERGWQYSKLTSIDAIEAGIVAQEEVDQARSQLPEAVFKELYMAEPSDDGGNPFGQEAIRKCIGDISGKTPTVYGVDLAKSVDWTVCIGLDEDGEVCRFDRYQLPWEETVRRLTREIGLTPAFIDSTGVGDPIVERIQKDLPNVEGYHFSSTSKQKLMEGLAVAIQTSEIKYPNGAIVSELDAFTFEYTRTGVRYTAPDGIHDDCVMALSLAVYGRTGAAGVGVW
jgi:phage FluMu gp28-like protein